MDCQPRHEHAAMRRLTHFVCQDAIKRLNDAGGMPPLRGLYHVCHGGRGCAPLRLNLADGAEPPCWEGFLELAIWNMSTPS